MVLARSALSVIQKYPGGCVQPSGAVHEHVLFGIQIQLFENMTDKRNLHDQKPQTCAGQIENQVIDVKKADPEQRLQQLHHTYHAKANDQCAPIPAEVFGQTGQKASHRKQQNQIAGDVPDDNFNVNAILHEPLRIVINGPKRDEIGLCEIKSDRAIRRNAAVKKQQDKARKAVNSECGP